MDALLWKGIINNVSIQVQKAISYSPYAIKEGPVSGIENTAYRKKIPLLDCSDVLILPCINLLYLYLS